MGKRAVVHSWLTRTLGYRVAAGWDRTIFRRAFFLDGSSDQRATRGAHSSSNRSAHDRARPGTDGSSAACGCITRSERRRYECSHGYT